MHLGEISLECSRRASAVAPLGHAAALPAVRRGEFAGLMGKGRQAAIEMYTYLESNPALSQHFRRSWIS